MRTDRPVHVLFVCADNASLSPLAAGLMALHARDRGLTVNVASAGLDTAEAAFDETVVWLLANRNVRFGRSTAQPVDQPLVDGADLILTMTRDQTTAVSDRFAVGSTPVLSVSEFVSAATATPSDAGGDIADPAGEPKSAYLRAHVELDHLMRETVSVLAARAEPSESGGAGGLPPVEPIFDLRVPQTGRAVQTSPRLSSAAS